MSALISLDAALDVATCGHKAASLAQLRGLGFDVPDGFVIPAGSQPTRDEVAIALERLGGGPVAVRSSGIAEDLADASFAGQYETVLNVHGADAVLAAAAACVHSASSPHLNQYAQAGQAMAVLVQQMVNADSSGVAFSANPLTGNRAEVRVSATRGLGDRLVSGEVNADEWIVRGGHASALATPQGAVTADLVGQVADLARKAEAVRLSPQDIEWAARGDQLFLLQSRPITVLPVAPAIDPPEGSWTKDSAHFAEPLSPFAVSTQMKHADTFLDEAIETWGLIPDGIRFQVLGHEPYTQVVPDDGGKNPPPWWALAAAVRLVPSLRRKLRTSAAAVAAGRLEGMANDWSKVDRPRLQREIARLASLDLTACDDAKLFAHLDELVELYARSLRLHFSLFIPHAVGLYELAVVCKDLLSWNLADTIGLLQGLSNTSTASSDDLIPIAQRASSNPTVRTLLEERAPDVLARLEAADPSLAEDLRRYLGFWGLRPLGPESGCPTLAERPHMVTDMVADLITETPRPPATRDVLLARAHSTLSGADRRRFDKALAFAERVYPLREDNVLFTDQLQVGLLRRVALELGRRLVSRGVLSRADDAVMLTADELKEALRGDSDVRPVVQRRKAEHAWVRANPGPASYGPAPGASPDLRGLPDAARRINRAVLWAMEHELSAPPAAVGNAVRGIGVSPGVYRGRVRVIRTPGELHRLRAGEVLVCPTTQAAWMIVFQRAGAIIADTGSVLSHTAIVAREFRLPAVVATGNATASLVDGEEVAVDGSTGIVTRIGT